MFITEKGTNRYLYLSRFTPFEVEFNDVTSRDGHTEVSIFFRNAVEFGSDESRRQVGLYPTVEEARAAFEQFMEVFLTGNKKVFEFDNFITSERLTVKSVNNCNKSCRID